MAASLSMQAALHKKILQLIIFPTEKCNFRCTYCYESFEIGKMKRATINGIKNLVRARIERGSLEALNFSWFGGEPLLAKDVVLELSEFAKELYDAGQLKVLSGETTTNAYLLTEPLLRKLVSLRQTSFQVSLDGYKEGHDQTRRRADGKGTFETIWTNLLTAKRSDIRFSMLLRLHITRTNVESMEKLVDAIVDEFGGDDRFSVFFKTIENLGGPNSADIDRVDSISAHERVIAASRKLNQAGIRCDAVIDGPESSRGPSIDAAYANDTPKQEVQGHDAPAAPSHPSVSFNGYICYASKPNSLIVRADGSVGKCTVMLDDPRNRLGTVNADGTIALDNEKMHLWMRGFKSFDPLELGCPAQNLPKLPALEQPIKFDKLREMTAVAA